MDCFYRFPACKDGGIYAQHDFIRDGMTMQAILLPWLKAVQIVMELVRLPNPFPTEIVCREGVKAFKRFLFHRRNPRMLIAR
jgi:hypothetical protein